MSKKLSILDLSSLVSESIEKFKNYFSGLIQLASEKSLKRASLIAYWVKDYVNYQLSEDSFDPTQLPRYARGDVVQVHFGYRVGSELGGRHYAIVIDVKNSWKSPVLVVVPLTSLKKEPFSENRFQFCLNTGLHELVAQKCNKQISDARLKQDKIERDCKKVTDIFESLSSPTKNDIEKTQAELNRLSKLNEESGQCIAIANKTYESMSHLKKGSILQVGQIATISKMRISNPKMQSDSLFGIKLSTIDMNRLNEKLKNLYIFESSSK